MFRSRRCLFDIRSLYGTRPRRPENEAGWAKATSNIYIYIASALAGEVSVCANRRMRAPPNTTFYDNDYALRRTIAGLAMDTLGENVGREFWTIGPGGVGQSLLTTMINIAISPMRGYFGCAAMRRDDELRKTLRHTDGYFVLTTTDEPVGSEENFSNSRHFPYRGIFPGDPILCRPPRAKTNKTLSTRGAVRFQTNRSQGFHNVRVGRWDIVYRRSIAIRMRAAPIPVEEYADLPVEIKETAGVFLRTAILRSS